MDVKKLLKVYNYVNDERKPKVNLKFMAGLAAFLISGFALTAFVLSQEASPSSSPGGGGIAGGGAAAQEGSKTDYVGLSPQELASSRLDPGVAEQRMREYREAHPERVIEKTEEVRSNGVLVGYRVTYRER